jgi:acetate kinase
MNELDRQLGLSATQGRIILAHLGSGASLTAVKDYKSIDTSMSFTPISGVPMSTRSGDLDPGLAPYLERTEGLDAKAFQKMVTFESGLLGLSETSADMAALLEKESQDFRAAEAIAVFCYQIKKCIGAFAAALGGLDQLVFTGGIGENAPLIRSRICDGLGFLGIEIDDQKNRDNQNLISKTGLVAVRVLRTDEEMMIAKLTRQALTSNTQGDFRHE